ncbi:hypothetical protein G6M12_22230 [Agrobacterium tumefaciens]|nr:hypothetical protein [Agrobacterium tumefaciens]
MAQQLRSTGTEVAAVKLGDDFSNEYFERLAVRALALSRTMAEKPDRRITCVLISALDGEDLIREREYFFPAYRRVQVNRDWRNNPASANRLVAVVNDYLRSPATKELTRTVSAVKDCKLLLPWRNTPSKTLLKSFHSIYKCETNSLDQKVAKEVAPQRKSKAVKVKDLLFNPVINGDQHPVRRCTDTCSCDILASFRFGAYVLPRFEFDVTADGGLKSKTFYLCDGSSYQITSGASHLNMRVNDDHRSA